MRMSLRYAKELALELMREHGITYDGWAFAWHTKKRAFGTCSYSRKTIYLSSVLTPHLTEEEVRDTILHEIAHAMVGAGHGHDRVWQRQALAIGCNGQRCGTGDTSNVKSKYSADCPVCGKTFKAHRRPKRKHWCMCTGRTFKDEEQLSYIQHY